MKTSLGKASKNIDFLSSPPPQWAKIMVHSTLTKWIYENGQIYEQNNC